MPNNKIIKPEFSLPIYIKKLLKVAQTKNVELYIVGGAVRDLFQNKTVQDWDFATNTLPEKILSIFPKNSYYNNKYGTVTINTDKKKIEITTFRSEKGYKDKRHPDIVNWGTSLQEDLSRRDFTINAIALKAQPFELSSEKVKFEVIDPYQGIKDIQRKLIRAVGNANDRINEDALRMIRAIRISAQTNFEIDKETLKAIENNWELIKNISWERIRDELFKILLAENSKKGIELLYQTKLLGYILPELEKGRGMDQPKHHVYDVWEHSLRAMQETPSKSPIVKLASLLHDVGKPYVVQGENKERTFHNHEVKGAFMVKNIAQRLRLSKKQSEKLFKLVRWHQFTVDEKITDKAIKRFIKRVGQDNIEDILSLRVGDRLGSGAKETSWRTELFKKRILAVQKEPFSLKDLKISGEDVMNTLQISPGPIVGKILNEIFAKVEEDKKLNSKKELLKLIKPTYKKLRG